MLRVDYDSWTPALAFSSDGSRLASGGAISSLWDATTGAELLTIHTFIDDERAVFVRGALTSCTPGAWRWLGWLAPNPKLVG